MGQPNVHNPKPTCSPALACSSCSSALSLPDCPGSAEPQPGLSDSTGAARAVEHHQTQGERTQRRGEQHGKGALPSGTCRLSQPKAQMEIQEAFTNSTKSHRAQCVSSAAHFSKLALISLNTNSLNSSQTLTETLFMKICLYLLFRDVSLYHPCLHERGCFQV